MMNHIYRTVWNEITRTYVAAAECVKSKGKPSKSSRNAEASEAAMDFPGLMMAERHASQAQPRLKHKALRSMMMPLALEQRFMFDGAAITTAVDPTHVDVAAGEVGDSHAADIADLTKVAPQAVAAPATSERKEVAFIDTGVADYQTLVAGIRTGVEVVLIESGQSGLVQIAEWAKTHTGYDAIHLLSHGEQGTIHLGRDTISQSNLADAGIQKELAALGSALTTDGDLLIYGCSVASGEAGQTFVANLAAATGADVAASEDLTGNAAKGGDWVLEQSAGSVEAATLEVLSYADALTVTGSSVTGYYWDGGGWQVWGTTTAIGGGVYWDLDNGSFVSTVPTGSNYYAYIDPTASTLTMSVAAAAFWLPDPLKLVFSDGTLIDVTGISQNSNTTGDALVASVDAGNKTIILTPDPTGDNSWNPSSTGSIVYTFTSTNTGPTVTLSINNTNIAEAAGTATLTATLSAAAASDTTVTLSAAGTATGGGADYTLSSNTITILAGQTTGTATITAAQDTLDEANETVIVDITGVSGGGGATESGSQQVTTTVTDDDAAPTVSIANVSQAEGNSGTSNMTFTATLSAASGQTVTVDYATSNGTATAGSDYTATSGTLTFNPGQTSKTFAVTIQGDSIAESDETLTATLSNPSNSTLGTASATGTIANDDNAAPTITGTPSDITVTEDTASNVDLSAVTVADADGDTLTITLTANAGTLAASSGGSVTVGGSGSGTLTLAGTADNINTFLDTASNIQYTGVSNVNGNNAATLTISASDGTTGFTSNPVVNLDITAVNDLPAVTATGSATAFTEQTPVVVDSGITISDVDGNADWNGGTLLVQITGNHAATDILLLPNSNPGGSAIWLNTTGNALMAGTTQIGTADASSVSDGSAWTFTFNASATNALVQATAQAVKFSNTSNDPSTNTRTVTFTATDKNAGSNTAAHNVSVTAVNDAPTVTNRIDSALAFSGGVGSYAVFPDVDSSISTAFTLEGWVYFDSLGGIQFISGKTLNQMELHTNGSTLRFIATSNAIWDTGSVLSTGQWTHIAATYDANTDTAKVYINGSTVTLTDGAVATDSDLQSTATQYYLGKRSDSTYPLSGKISEFRIWNDVRTADEIRNNQNVNLQGNEANLVALWKLDEASGTSLADSTGNGFTGTASSASWTNRPLSGGLSVAFTEGGSPVSLFNGMTVSAVENGQTIPAMTLTVTNVGTNAESLSIDGSNVSLVNGTSGTTASHNVAYSVSVSGGTATVSLSKGGGLSEVEAQSLLNGLTYSNSSNDPSSSNRVVTLTSIQDSGGTTNGGADTASPALAATVAVNIVNNAPTLTATGATPTFTEGDSVVGLFSSSAISVVEAGQNVQQLVLTVTNVGDGASEIVRIDGSDVGLNHTNSVTTATNGMTAAVSVSGGTATVTISKAGGISASLMQTLIDALAYKNASEAPTAGNRVVTLTSIQDTGGTSNGGVDSTTLSVGATVTVVAVNDAPTDIALTANAINQSAATAGATIGTVSGSDPENDTLTYTLVSGTGSTDNAKFSIVGSTLKIGSDALSAGTYNIRVRATDNGTGNLTYEEAFTLTVTDNVAPTLSSSTPADNASGIAPSANLSLVFSETITAGTGNITLINVSSGATVETFNIATGVGSGGGTASISGNTLILNPSANLAEATQYAIQVAGTAIKDGANNTYAGIADNSTLNFTTGATDSSVPVVQSIQRTAAENTNAATLTYTVKFNEAVTEADATDFAISATGSASGTITGVTGSGTDTLTVTVGSVTGTGKLGLNFKNTQNITDIAGNALANGDPADDEVYNVDRTLPTLLSLNRLSSGSGTVNATSVQFIAVFSEPVTGLSAADFALTGSASGTISAVSGDGTPAIIVTVSSISGNGSLGLALVGTPTITDSFGNSLAVTSPSTSVSESYTIDSTLPTAVSILRNSAERTTGGTLTFDVVFSETVANVTADDFVLTGTATGTIASVTGSGSAYTVTVNSVAGNGTLGLSYAGGQNIADAAGNAFAGVLPSRSETYTVDTTAPTITAIKRAGVNQIAASTATSAVFTVEFSEAVSGISASDFTVTGNAGHGAVSVSSADGKVVQVTVAGVNDTVGKTLGLSFTGSVNDSLSQVGSANFTTGDVYTIGGVLLNEGALDQASLDALIGANRDGMLQLVDAAGTATEVVIIDSRVPGLAEQVAANIRAGADVWLLDAKSSAISQISRILAQYNGLTAVHLISHGSAGAVYLGAETISSATLAGQAETLAAWGRALAESGDFLIYGCDVAKGDAGTAFVHAFAAATGADVAASDDLTGAGWLGGDWALETSSGKVDVQAVVLADYERVLASTITMNMADGSIDAATIYARPNGGISNVWVFGNGWFGYASNPYEYLPITEVALIGDPPPAGCYVQYSTDGGSNWTNLTTVNVSTSGKVWRYVNASSSTSDYTFTFSYNINSSAYLPGVNQVGSGLTIKPDNPPTDIAISYPSGATATLFTDTAQGTNVATLTPTDTGNVRRGYWAIESQSVANLFSLSSNTATTNVASLALGSGTIPAAGQSATVTVRYYDFLQTDTSNNPIGGSGYSKTLTFNFEAESTQDLADFGNDFKLNTTTSGEQSMANVAKLSNGNYVATWISEGQSDAGFNSVIAQVFTSAGVKVGSEIVVSPANNGAGEYYANVTALDNGRFVVAYLRNTDPDGDADVAYVIVEANGTVGSEQVANVATDRIEENLSIANLGNGTFVVAWNSYNADWSVGEVFARTFNISDGSPASAEQTVRGVAELAGGIAAGPSVTALSGGDYVTTWAEYDSGWNLTGVFGRIGSGSAFQITSHLDVYGVRLATLTGGGFVAVWSHAESGNNDVYFQRFNSAGVAQGTATIANVSTAGSQEAPTVAALSGGGFVIGWESGTGDYSSTGVFGRRFAADGTPVDNSDFEINQHRRNGQSGLSLAAGAGDAFVATWTDDAADGTSNKAIEARIYTPAVVGPNVTLSVSNASVAEAAGTSTVTATLSAIATTDTVVTLSASGTATGGGTDYTLSSNTITILAGQTTGTATITAVQDALDEADETVIIDIASVSGGDGAVESGTQQATVTIADDDASPSVSIADVSVAEGNSGTTTMTFTATLSAASGKTVTVDYATSNGSATAGSDYVAASGTLTFAPGETSKTFTVTVNGDTTAESSETLQATLSSPSNATLGTGSATGTITNDDNALPTISDVSNQTINENAATSALALTVGDTETAAVDLTLAGSSSNTALIPDANIVFSGSGANRTVTITPAANQTGTATITLTVSDGNGGTSTDTFTVTVNDVNPAISAATHTVDENANAGTVVGTVTATGDTNGLAYSITGGTGSSLFEINSSTGVITVKSGAVLNYESASSYGLNIAVDDEDADATADSTALITINLNDLNEAPTDIALGAISFTNTQSGAGVTLTTISGTDPDTTAPNNNLSYSLVTGAGDTNNASFVIDGTSLKVASGSALAAGTYNIRLRATDGGTGNLTYEKTFAITVTDPLPTLQSASPADNATGVAVTSNIVLSFSENITLGTGNIVLYDITGAGANSVTIDVADHAGQLSVSGSTLTINPTADFLTTNQYAVRIAATAIKDSTNQGYVGVADNTTLNFTTGSTDTTPPVVTIVDLADPSSTNAGTATIRFSEQVQNLDIGDFTLTCNGNPVDISGLAIGGSGSVYTLDLSSVTTTAGTYVLTLSPATIQDTSGNALSAGVSETFVIDKTAPTGVAIVRASANPMPAGTASFTVVFSEAVSGVTADDFALTGTATGGGIAVTPVSDSVYTVTVSGVSGNGTLGLDLKTSGTGITDTAGNAISGGLIGQSFTVDNIAPTVTAINRNGAAVMNDGSASFTVSFDESVSGVTADDFTFDASGVSTANGASDISVTGSGSTYTVTVANMTGSGTLSIDLKASGTGIVDLAGNTIATGFTDGDVYTRDTTNPIITASQSFDLPENMTAGFVVGQVRGSDTNGVVNYAITSGNTDGFFAIDSNGVISLTTAGAAIGAASRDYEITPNAFSLGVTATDGAGNTSSSQTVTINVLDAMENAAAPALTGPTLTMVDTAADDSLSNQSGTLSATDVDGIASYGIAGGVTGGSTLIGGVTYDLSKAGT